MELRSCRACFEALPLEQFYADSTHPGGLKSSCKGCRARMRRRRDLLKRGMPIGLALIASEDAPTAIYIKKRYYQFNSTRKNTQVPVSYVNHPAPLLNGCVICATPQGNRIVIATAQGPREYQWEATPPEALLSILRELGLKVRLPSPKDSHD